MYLMDARQAEQMYRQQQADAKALAAELTGCVQEHGVYLKLIEEPLEHGWSIVGQEPLSRLAQRNPDIALHIVDAAMHRPLLFLVYEFGGYQWFLKRDPLTLSEEERFRHPEYQAAYEKASRAKTTAP